MGVWLKQEQMAGLIDRWKQEHILYGPKIFEGEGMYSDTDVVRYGEIKCWEDLVFDRKSDYSFKEVLLPVSQVLFYFTEDQVKEAKQKHNKRILLFLRSCDGHALKRLDEIYLRNGCEDYYYKRIRELLDIAIIGCKDSFESCFCTSMDTNRPEKFEVYLEADKEICYVESLLSGDGEWMEARRDKESSNNPGEKEIKGVPSNYVQVIVPENLDLKQTIDAPLWKEYDSRCIHCGRCNIVCPTCTCYTMQDIFYSDNENAGERRRVHASCMVDGYTDVAGGGSYRRSMGERMRFKVMHKVYDFKKRFGYHMCVGCGRCDDVCPEYISFSRCVNRLSETGN